MARDRGRRHHGGDASTRRGAYRVPGLRAHQTAYAQRMIAEGDPRLTAGLDPDIDAKRIRDLNRHSPVIAEYQRQLEALQGGEVVRMPRWLLGGNSFPAAKPEWPLEVKQFDLHPGDWCVPVEPDE
jgi:hypothetical protein